MMKKTKIFALALCLLLVFISSSSYSVLAADDDICSYYSNSNEWIPEPYLISKWGPGPIVAHYQSLCPNYNGSTVYYYYHR